jgi:hypothetical protein
MVTCPILSVIREGGGGGVARFLGAQNVWCSFSEQIYCTYKKSLVRKMDNGPTCSIVNVVEFPQSPLLGGDDNKNAALLDLEFRLQFKFTFFNNTKRVF